MVDIDVRIIGSEYKDKTFTGRATCAARGIEIYFNRRDHRFSTSDLRKRVAMKDPLIGMKDGINP
jgi:glycerol-3-phosphate cytidylyltransferase